MKYIALITALLFLNHSSSAQKERLIDYFYSDDYQTKSFKWNIDVTETQILSKKENGLIVIGSVNTLPNGKRIINEGYYRPYSKEIIHTVGRTSATNKLTRFDEPIIKYPKSNWETSKSIYSCYLSSTKTDFNEYKKCIAVKEKGKLIKGTTIRYYAYGIGLVHVKAFGNNGKLVFEKQLIDNAKKSFSKVLSNNISDTIETLGIIPETEYKNELSSTHIGSKSFSTKKYRIDIDYTNGIYTYKSWRTNQNSKDPDIKIKNGDEYRSFDGKAIEFINGNYTYQCLFSFNNEPIEIVVYEKQKVILNEKVLK